MIGRLLMGNGQVPTDRIKKAGEVADDSNRSFVKYHGTVADNVDPLLCIFRIRYVPLRNER
jgi:hypothetical protein